MSPVTDQLDRRTTNSLATACYLDIKSVSYYFRKAVTG